jgi:signal transduction histidine kinase
MVVAKQKGPSFDPACSRNSGNRTETAEKASTMRRLARSSSSLMATLGLLAFLVLTSLVASENAFPYGNDVPDALHVEPSDDQRPTTVHPELSRFDSLGRAFLAKELLDSAMVNFLKALAVAERSDDRRAIATCYINVANVLILKNDLPKSITYLELALNIHRVHSDSANIGACYNNLAAIHLQLDSLSLARAYLDSALVIHVARGNDRGIAACEQNMGIVLGKLGQRKEAVAHFERALEANRRMGDHFRIATTLSNLAVLHVEMGNHRTAIDIGRKGILLCDSVGIVDAKRSILENLVKAFVALGMVDSAFHFLQAKSILNDSLSKLEQEQRIVELERRYDNERKASQITVLQQDIGLKEARLAQSRITTLALTVGSILAITLLIILWRLYRLRTTSALAIADKNKALQSLNADLTVTADKLKTSIATKDRFFTVLAHDLKGPIGTYRSISRMLERSLGELSKQQIQEQIQYLSRSSSHVHDLLENLLLWATSQTGTLNFSPREVDVHVLIHRSVTIMEDPAAAKGIQISMENQEEVLAYCDANMILVVLNNLISNAIRFSPKGGEVLLRCTPQTDHVEVEVRDQGIEIASADLPGLFDTGTDRRAIGDSPEKGSGIGLLLCHEFVARNGGKLSVESVLGKGSTFRFSIPLPPVPATTSA